MSIFPQMSGFDLWMIINLSDSDAILKVSYQIFKCHSSICFFKWMVLYDSMIF